jgi:hypothetical protein
LSHNASEDAVAWERRKGHRYYYTARRSESGVAKAYFGRGPLAEAVAGLDDQQRRRRAAQAAAERADRAQLEPADQALAAFEAAADLVMTAVLTIHGFHRQNYSRWRRRRA